MLKKALSWLLPITTLIVFAATSALVLYPWSQDVLDRREKIPQKQERLSQLVTKLKALNSLNEEQVQEYLLDLEIVLPSESQPPLILASLESLAGKVGLAVGAAQYTGVQENVVMAELQAGGEYTQIVDFLNQLQASAPVLQIKSLKLSREKDAQDETEVTSENPLQQALLQAAAPYRGIVSDLGEIETQVKQLSESEKKVLQKAQALETLLKPVDEAAIENVEKGKENPFKL